MTDVFTRKMKLKAKCWHTGSYASHDEGCFEWRYEKIEGPLYRKVDPGQPVPWWFVEVGEEVERPGSQ